MAPSARKINLYGSYYYLAAAENLGFEDLVAGSGAKLWLLLRRTLQRLALYSTAKTLADGARF